ncbi:MAG: hypothetical protein ACD_62C00609G0001 [uncultured bacterium]|nr:MAG: hypothetical protein ACD_62C00609G0001 [uncultured bacterium]
MTKVTAIRFTRSVGRGLFHRNRGQADAVCEVDDEIYGQQKKKGQTDKKCNEGSIFVFVDKFHHVFYTSKLCAIL